MPEILIEINEKDLQAIERIAKENHRSRRAQVVVAIEEWLKGEKN
jgi:hypothetical protein